MHVLDFYDQHQEKHHAQPIYLTPTKRDRENREHETCLRVKDNIASHKISLVCSHVRNTQLITMCSSTTNKSTTKPLPSLPPYDESQAICVENLTFSYDPKSLAPTLRDLNLKLPKGSRCLLIGANG